MWCGGSGDGVVVVSVAATTEAMVVAPWLQHERKKMKKYIFVLAKQIPYFLGRLFLSLKLLVD